MSGIDQSFVEPGAASSQSLPVGLRESGFPLPNAPVSRTPLHRIAEVRRSQNVSLASVAKQMNVGVSTAREMEQPWSNLSVRELYQWQRILDVPIAELLIDPEDLPRNPIQSRGQLVRLMKTARSILEIVKEERLRILAQMMVDQMIEIMPELENIAAWPSVGQSREFKDYGQAIYRRFDSQTAASLEE